MDLEVSLVVLLLFNDLSYLLFFLDLYVRVKKNGKVILSENRRKKRESSSFIIIIND